MSLLREAGYHDGRKQIATVRSDAAGEVTLTPVDAGHYLLLVRHRDTAPPAVGAPYMSYTVTLAFEAL